MRACQPKDSKRRDWRSASGREKERKSTHTHMRERKWEREKALWLLPLYVFPSTWACPMQIGFSPECCFFRRRQWHPTPGPWTLLDIPCLLATTILDSFPYSTYLTISSSNIYVHFQSVKNYPDFVDMRICLLISTQSHFSVCLYA